MKKYWKSLDELKDKQDTASFKKEVEPEFSIEGLSEEEVSSRMTPSRRDFLKVLGFSVGYATLAASCEQPIRKAIPYLNKPEEVVPGMANYYASTYYDGHDYCPVVVKVRDGRPIKIEGNELSSITEGGTNARVQASVLSLYDSGRLKQPLKQGNPAEWDEVDSDIIARLSEITDRQGKIAILSHSVISPSTQKVFEDFKTKYPNTEVIYYDSVSYAAMRLANEKTFGKAEIPSYRFDLAEVIVGFNADFLGGWLSPVEFAGQYAKTRALTESKKTISKHYQFESYMSLTGSNADIRVSIKPSDELTVLLNVYNKIAEKSQMEPFKVDQSPVDIEPLVHDLMSHQGKSLVVSGTNDVYIQSAVNGINFLLASLGGTLNFERTFKGRLGNDAKMNQLVDDLNAGTIEALILNNVNPAYDFQNAAKFQEGIKKAGLSIALTSVNDETAQLSTYVCPDHHYLESWNDAEIYTGRYSLVQPTIHNINNSRQAQESLLKWAGVDLEYHQYIRNYWEENLFSQQSKYIGFNDFWNHALQNGIFDIEVPVVSCPMYNFYFIEAHTGELQSNKPKGLELILYEKIGIGTGIQANNPWLQELPDPISKAVWDNYLALSPTYANEQGFAQEDVVKINDAFELPVLIQPGQPHGTVSIALGYGRTAGGKVANGLGQNAFGLVAFKNGSYQLGATGISIEKTGETYPIATTQTYHSLDNRSTIVRETVLDKWVNDPEAGNDLHKINEEKSVTLYKQPKYGGFHWGLGIDMNKCTGCSACVVACQAENNIAVIGKEEVKNKRIMHWIRIDRYYSTEEEKIGSAIVSENPEVVHQPIMCQHCDNAPCENVCPVAATTHSKEGLNQSAYNRCIGTRYCMNNCPYRVRRFNWYQYVDNDKFDYNFNDELSKMVLNPDVVVRERGVVEKCTFCIQRIQEKKLDAKKESRIPVDGEIQPACVQSCPSKALVFGDMNDKESRISKHMENPRMYNLLEELHTLPSVGYLTKVRNREADASHEGEHHSA